MATHLEASMIRRVVRNAIRVAGIVVAIVVGTFVAFSEMKKRSGHESEGGAAEGFTIVGIAVRTRNAEQTTPERPIGKQWEQIL